MPAHWRVEDTPGDGYRRWSESRPMAFAAESWSGVVSAAGARPVYAWHEREGFGTLVACFRRGPLRVGVCGFPVAGPDWDRLSEAEALAEGGALCRAAGLDVLRVNRNLRSGPEMAASAIRPESWIADLARYDPSADRRLRKDLALAHRAGGGTHRVARELDPRRAHAMYLDTVARHRGEARYGEAYFAALARLASPDGALRAYSVPAPGGGLLGFAVLALHGGRGHYLHGATSAAGRRAGVSDLLLEALVADARDAGAGALTMLASPWEQPGLQAFKAKWSETRGYSVTHDVAGSVVGRGLRLWLAWRARGDRPQARVPTGASPR